MLDDLRRIIESEMEYDDLNDILIEATDNAIASMFIEEDGEAVMSEAEVMSVLEKIPEYDEEAAMNKKLERIAEAYIPEELGDGVEEGLFNRLKMRKMSNNELRSKIDELEADNNPNEAGRYRNELERRMKKEEKKNKKMGVEPEQQAQESVEIDDEEYLEEGFKDALIRLKRSFTKKGREYNKDEKYLSNVRRAFDIEFNNADENKLNEMKKGLLDAINTNEPILAEEEDAVIKQMMEKQTEWMKQSIKRIEDKLNAVKESYDVEEDLTYLFEAFDLEDLL